MRLLGLILALLLGGGVAACSAVTDTKAAEAQAVNFHRLLDEGKFDAIYATTSDDLRKVSSKVDFSALLDAIHRKLGKVKSTKLVGWNVNNTTNGRFTALNYETSFDKGSGIENFVFRYEGDVPKLAGYHINSNAMLIN